MDTQVRTQLLGEFRERFRLVGSQHDGLVQVSVTPARERGWPGPARRER